jgi:hypothetical protein
MRVARPGRCAGRCCRIHSRQTSVADPQPLPPTCPNLHILDRIIAGLCSQWIQPPRLPRVAIAFKPSTFLGFHRAMAQCKYRFLFSPKQKRKPGPKGLPVANYKIGPNRCDIVFDRGAIVKQFQSPVHPVNRDR